MVAYGDEYHDICLTMVAGPLICGDGMVNMICSTIGCNGVPYAIFRLQTHFETQTISDRLLILRRFPRRQPLSTTKGVPSSKSFWIFSRIHVG